MEGTITTGTTRKMSQRYLCPAEYTSKTTNRQLTLKETKFGARVRARVSQVLAQCVLRWAKNIVGSFFWSQPLLFSAVHQGNCMVTSFDYNYQNALRQAVVFSILSFVKNHSCGTQICITKIAGNGSGSCSQITSSCKCPRDLLSDETSTAPFLRRLLVFLNEKIDDNC